MTKKKYSKQNNNETVVVNNKKDKLEKIIIGVLFLLLFFAGLIGEKKVGFYNDELYEQNILRGNVLEYAELLGNWNDLSLTYHERTVIAISQSVERDHGVATYLPLTPFLAIDGVSKEIFSLIWHSYTFALFFLGVIMVYAIMQELFKNRKISLAASLLYLSSPRIFAEGLYNNKDIVLMSLVLATIYCGMKFIEKKSFKSAIILGIVAAFAFNVKIIGGFMFGVVGLFYLIDYLKNSYKNNKFLNKELAVGLVAIVVMIATFIAITPAIWGSGWDLNGYIEWCLTESTKFSRWRGTVLFEGKLYSYAANQMLPLYYLPKMILITTPIYILVFFAIGLFYIFYNAIKKQETDKNNTFVMVLICMLVPFLAALLTHARLYNGWRHFYFIYGPMALISFYGIYNLAKVIKYKKTYYTIIGGFIAFYLFACLHNGVYNTAYYNILVNHKDISEEYELDYYGTSAKVVLEQAEANKVSDKVYIYSAGYGYNVLENNKQVLSMVKRDRVIITNSYDKYEEWVKDGKEVYIYYNNVYVPKTLIKGHKKVYSNTSWGNDMSVLYQ